MLHDEFFDGGHGLRYGGRHRAVRPIPSLRSAGTQPTT
jgi:hypothetical protein